MTPTDELIRAKELEVLRALLQEWPRPFGAPRDPQGKQAGAPSSLQPSRDWKGLLTSYRFREPLHQVVFDILCELPALDPAALREQLLRQLTNRGFPDVDVGPLFLSPKLSPAQLDALIRTLRDERTDSR